MSAYDCSLTLVYSSGVTTQPHTVPVYDVSTEDQCFLMARFSDPSNEAAGELIVVENFFEELKAKVGN